MRILGVPNIKIPKLCFGKVGVDNSKLNNVRICRRQRPVRYTSLVRRLEKAFSIGCSPTLETQATTNLGDDSKETKMSGSTSQLIPNSSGVESLVRDICSTTSIAEFELKLSPDRYLLQGELNHSLIKLQMKRANMINRAGRFLHEITNH
ncbi:biotin carboxyl carrier protein of acetyl-CoA carboxylase [Gossypium australe]|uniref:Biotin carboxyl carrier protein of acetyl-CoA carboxylase n=1 Tax=Gossypium australe TaxID=47621 RepID=A0A5B6WDK5_9ROSI|nr:biotin carboxyl carrier protein of acetyl-CoA carboxylase [Gossypium australe]